VNRAPRGSVRPSPTQGITSRHQVIAPSGASLTTFRRRAAPVALLTLASFFSAALPVRSARAGTPEEAQPVDAPNFADSTNHAKAPSETGGGGAKAGKARSAPVSASGAFTHSFAFQVPPGRRGMTPALALGYDSGGLASSPVGVGWGFFRSEIARSTREGFPRTVGTAPRRYDDSAPFTSPSGELVPAVDGPAGAGRVFMPRRETSPVRYELVPTDDGDAFVEHDPSGIKRYYGRDPFTKRTARVRNELGTHAWLLLREEDPWGNEILYDYWEGEAGEHRADRKRAQVQPVLRSVAWGGNRKTGHANVFAVRTQVEPQAGPLNMLEGHVVLEHRIGRLDVSVEGRIVWSYRLEYRTSDDTGRELLHAIHREGDTPETTRFGYTRGKPESGPRWVDMGELAELERVYSDNAPGIFNRSLSDAFRRSATEALQAPGHRGGTKFLDLDGNGTTDILYHAPGIGTTATHVLWDDTWFQSPSPSGLGDWTRATRGPLSGPPGSELPRQPRTHLPYFPRNGRWATWDLGRTMLQDVVDLDGDGDADGVTLPVNLSVDAELHVVLPAGLTPHTDRDYPAGQMRLRTFANTAKSSGVTLPAEQLLPNWPTGVDLSTGVVMGAVETERGDTELRYRVYADSDVQTPIVDLNGDGKPDYVLMKHVRRWAPDASHDFGIVHRRDLDAWTDRWRLHDAGTTRAPLGNLIAQLQHEGAFVFVAHDLLAREEPAPEIVMRRTTFEHVGYGSIVPPDRQVVALSAPGPAGPGGPLLPPGGDGRGPVLPPKGPPWQPEIIPEGCVFIPLDPNWGYPEGPAGRGGVKGIVASIVNGEHRFVPRAYLQQGAASRQFVSEDRGRPSDFEATLQARLNRASSEECGHDCAYPVNVSFDAFFADVNNDGLPDLVAAPVPPHQGVTPRGTPWAVCENGHEVLLNRGYGFEATARETYAGEWSSRAVDHPLNVVANRSDFCSKGDNPHFVDGSSLPPPVAPMAALAQTDVNADGRVDLVVAYQPDTTDRALPLQQVYLNDGRGFTPAGRFDLPPRFALAYELQLPMPPSYGLQRWPRGTWPDTGRFVDLDDDGLVDLVQPGRCRTDVLTSRQSCVPARWWRNAGDVPDRLERSDSSSGAWTSVGYAPAKGALVTTKPEGARPPSSLRVASRIRSAVGPESDFPVQEIFLRYENYVRDAVGAESLGFERVVADFVNAFEGRARETVRTTRAYDVRAELLDEAGVPLPVRNPLRGTLRESIAEADGWTQISRSALAVERLGEGVRIRPAGERNGLRAPSGAEAWTGSDVLARDAFGFALRIQSGNVEADKVGPVAQVVTRAVEREHRTSSAWQLGLVTRATERGYSETFAGGADVEHVLSDITSSHTPEGALASTVQHGASPEGCAPSADAATLYEYEPFGQVKLRRDVGRREIRTEYEPHGLYARRVSTTVGGVTLATTVHVDLRTGATTSTTDPNGVTSTASFDSRGRTLEQRGPGGFLLEQHVYADAYPPTLTSTIATDVGASYARRVHLDGAGSAVAVVEGLGTADVPYVRTSLLRRDAFGREVESYLPTEVPSLDAIAASGAKTVMQFDGLDRHVSATNADGTTTTFAYEPRAATETNARGVKTRRVVDAFDRLFAVHRDVGGPDASSHFLVRDGRGDLVRVVDGDGSERRIERDGNGNVRFMELPHAPGVRVKPFTLCHDLDGKLAAMRTPAGRTLIVARDALGRPLSTKEIAPDGEGRVTERAYDGTQATHGLGRLTSRRDESGDYELSYDAWGRPSQLVFTPSLRVEQTVGERLGPYKAAFTYSQRGALTAVRIDAAARPAILTYVRNARARITEVRSSDGQTTRTLAADLTYDVDGAMRSARLGNGTYAEWERDPQMRRLHAVRYLDVAGELFASVDYGYDDVGNLTREDRRKGGESGFYTQKAHAYDRLDRLASSDVHHPHGSRREELHYSPAGTLLGTKDEAYAYESEATAQAVSFVKGGREGKRAFSYDDDGYLTDERSEREDGTRRHRTVSFDAAGCLAELAQEETDPRGPVLRSRSSYVCGLDGRTVARRSTDASGRVVTRVDFAGLAEVRPAEGIVLLRLPLNGSVTVEEARSLATGERVPTASGYVHADARGSVLAMSDFDRSRGLTREAEYDAWGAAIDTGFTAPTHAFVDHEPDLATGIYTFGLRAYDPTLRRWLSPDPLLLGDPSADSADGAQLGLYTYARSNPTTFVDPSGLQDQGVALRNERLSQAQQTGTPAEQERAKQQVEMLGKANATFVASVVTSPAFALLPRSLYFAGVLLTLTQASNHDDPKVLQAAAIGAGALGARGAAAAPARAAEGESAVAGAAAAPVAPVASPAATAAAAPAAGAAAAEADALQILQKIVTDVNRDLKANPALAATVLNRAEQEAAAIPRVLPMQWGNAVERLTAERVLKDPVANAVLEPVGGPGKPDFVGQGAATGRMFDITTPKQIDAHVKRPYGKDLEFATYER